MKAYSKISISQCLVLIITPLALANIFLSGKLSLEFGLIPIKVINYLELWRLFTFPFSGGSIESTLLFALTFYFVAPKLEQILNKSLYLLLLFLLICLQGTIQTLVFWKSELVFAGAGGISFFVLSLFVLLNLNKFAPLARNHQKYSSIFPFAIMLLWLIALLIHSSFTFQKEIFLKNLPDLVFGVFTGALTFLQIAFIEKILNPKKAKQKSNQKQIEELLQVVEEEKDYALLEQEKKIVFKALGKRNFPPAEKQEMVFTEDGLNQILDKINEFGKNSLTYSELTYLKEYSKIL